MPYFEQIFRITVLILFPFLVGVFVWLYWVDEKIYSELLAEDQLIEWLSFSFLLLAGLLALDIAIEIRHQKAYTEWFFVGFAIFCILVAFEEISWGERVFRLQPPEFFDTYSDQQEVNLHNVLQLQLNFKTKTVAGLVLVVYGAFLPLLGMHRQVKELGKRLWPQVLQSGRNRLNFIVPPPIFDLWILTCIPVYARYPHK